MELLLDSLLAFAPHLGWWHDYQLV